MSNWHNRTLFFFLFSAIWKFNVSPICFHHDTTRRIFIYLHFIKRVYGANSIFKRSLLNSYYFNDRIFYLGSSVLIYCDTGDLVCDNEVFNIILRYLWLFVRGSGVCHRSDVLKSSLLFWNKYWYDVKRWDCLVIIFNWLVDFFDLKIWFY